MPKRRDQAFPPEVRLHKKSEFDRVVRNGVSVSDGRLHLRALGRGEGFPTRLGITVGRKYGGAVSRNRLKRLLREAFRCSGPDLPGGLDLVVFPVHPARNAPPRLEEIRVSLTRLAGRARDRIEARRRKGPGRVRRGPRRGTPR